MKHVQFLNRAIFVLLFGIFFSTNALAQNTVINGNRSIVGSLCVGSSAAAIDTLSICKAPVASATRVLLNLSNTALSGGSAAGTYLGANPAACTGDFIRFQLANSTQMQLACTGAIYIASTFVSGATGSLGWTVQNAANQACNTTCTTGACVVGLDTAVLGNFLLCTDATADTCLCAG